MCVRADLEEAGRFIERLHRAVADGQVPRVCVGDDDLQGGRVHVPQVDVGLLTLAEAAHEHGPVAGGRQSGHRDSIEFTKITNVQHEAKNKPFGLLTFQKSNGNESVKSVWPVNTWVHIIVSCACVRDLFDPAHSHR